MQQFTTTCSVEPIYSWREARPLFGMSRTTAWRMVRAGTLPKPVHISPGRIGWRHSDIAAWQARCAGVVQPGDGGLASAA
jgi:predicted DNA-binding transcriptional regulator AlpA